MSDAEKAKVLAASLAAGRAATRVSGTKNSYRKDNPGEYAKVMAYLDGGARPTGELTKMGLHLVLEEDVRITLTQTILPVSTPPAIAGQGYALVWHDEFDSLSYNNSGSIDDAYTWQRPYNGTNSAGTATATGSVLTMTYTGGVGGKALLLATRKGSSGSPNLTGSFKPPVYFEASIRPPTQIGQYWQWWMASLGQVYGQCCTTPSWWTGIGGSGQLLNPEIDIVEGWYDWNTPSLTYTGTIHYNTPGGTGAGDTCGIADSGPTVGVLGGSLTDGNFHRFGCWWDTNGATFYQDDVATHAKITTPIMQPQPLFLVLGLTAFSYAPVGSWSMDVDWVRVWQP